MKSKLLFILKRCEDFDPAKHSTLGMQTGLFNSARFIQDMLLELGLEARMVVVTDNNDIDREVAIYRPTHVIIEALWVVPSKFDVLQKLHPNVTWIVRLHSEIPFIAQEGISADWIGDYLSFKNVNIAVNSPRALSDVRTFLSVARALSKEEARRRVIYLPNYFPIAPSMVKVRHHADGPINVGCFGAVRPLKKHRDAGTRGAEVRAAGQQENYLQHQRAR